MADYRAGYFPAAVTALEQALELRQGGDASERFFLAMAHWQQGHKDEARNWYNQAFQWMDKNGPGVEELHRFRREAAALLGVQEQQDPKGKDAPSAQAPGP